MITVILGFLAWRSASAATVTLVPNSDISSAWPTCSTTCTAMMQYSYVDEGTTVDTTDWIGTGTSGGGGEVVEFGLSTVSNVSTATQVVVNANLRSATLGSDADTVGFALRVNGTLQAVTTVTMTTAFTNYTATFTGNWNQSDVDSMQIYLIRNVVGGGQQAGRDDDVQLANAYATLTYTPSVQFEQSAYRWFNNQDVTGDISFSKSFGDTGLNTGVFIDETADGGYVITGETADGGTSSDMYLAKYDKGGSLSWSRHWGGSGLDVGNVVAQTSDGGYIVTGLTASYGAGGNDVLLAKYDSTGALSWDVTWGGTNNDVGRSVIQTSDGGYAVTGFTLSAGAGGADMILLKFDSSGGLSWSTTWGGTVADRGHSVYQTPDGGYVITGETSSFGAGGVDAILVKYDSAGALQWDRTWGGAGTDNGRRVVPTSDGGYAVGGFTDSFGAGLNDLFLAKFDSTGALAWSKTWGGPSEDYGYSLAQTSDNGFILVGDTASFGSGINDVNVIRYDSVGTLVWNTVWGGSGGDLARDAVQTADGGYAVVGNGQSYGAGGHDIVLQKYNSSGVMAGCSAPLCQTPTATETSPTDATLDPAASTTTPAITAGAPVAGEGAQSFTHTSVVDLYPQINVSTPLAATDSAAPAPAAGTPFRLRMNLHVGVADAEQNNTTFKLQIASRGTDNICDTSFSGETYSDVTIDSGAIRFFNNSNSYDTQSLASSVDDPSHAGHTTILQTYEEANGFTVTNTITTGQDGLWDFPLVVHSSAPVGTSYCLRAVKADGGALTTYTSIPQLDILTPTLDQSSYRFYENADSTTPGAALAADNTAVSVATGSPFRLRQLISQTAGSTPAGTSFKLQAGEKVSTCSAATYTDLSGTQASTGVQQTATVFANDTSNGGTVSWANLTNAATNNGLSADATDVIASATNSAYLKASGYGFSIPENAVITGVSVEAELSSSSGLVTIGEVKLSKGGAITGTSQATMSSNFTGTYTWGGTTNLWGTTLTPAEVNDAGFGVGIYAQYDPSIDPESAYVDYIAINVHYAVASTTDVGFHNNAAVADDAVITTTASDPVPSSGTVTVQTYNENYQLTNPVSLSSGSNGLWDFAIIGGTNTGGKTYCFRFVTSDGSALATYTYYPEVTFGGGPTTATLNQQLRGGQSVIDGVKRGFLW